MALLAACGGGSNSIPPGPSITGGGTAYDARDLQADIANVLQARPGILSGRYLGNTNNIALWNEAKILSLLGGISAAWTYYPHFDVRTLARLILAEGAQESTGDYRVQGQAVGFLQVTPTTVLVDYQHHGLAVQAQDGTAVLDPGMSIDLTDPGQNVALWAWSSRNNVTAGESADEVAANMHRATHVTRDYGNVPLAWLAGPGYDRHTLTAGSTIATDYSDYITRIEDYYVQAGWGTTTAFAALLDTPVDATLMAFRDAPAGFIP